jgi:hypothetical protein
MQLDSEEGRLIKSARASLDVTCSSKVAYVYIHTIRLKVSSETVGRRQQCLAAGIYRNVTDVIGAGNEF